MKIKLFSIISLLSLGAYTASAQDPIDIFNVSQTNFSSYTARSAAMGGAFTALGADGASASINPAGIGMYRTNDIGMTGSVLAIKANSTTSGALGNYQSSAKETTVPLNNITAMFNVYNSKSGSVRAINIGFAYNQMQNYSYKQYTTGNFTQGSMADLFAAKLYDVNPKDILSSSSDPLGVYREASASFWGPMMAYNTGLLYVTNDQPYKYTLSSGDNGTLFLGDEVYPELSYNNTGRKGDYAFTAGFNLIDKIYIGATLAYQDYQYSKYQLYSEFANVKNNAGDLDLYDYSQQLTTTGDGFSFKFGITAEPIKGLKLAVAVHAPTIYNIKDEYYADMTSYFTSGSVRSLSASTPYFLSEYKVHTPTVFLAGISYVLGKTAIVSFDYDRTFYNKMKVANGLGQAGRQSLNASIADNYQAVNNFRAGAEFRFLGVGYLRAGYAYYGNPLKNESSTENVWHNISGGIGVKAGVFYCDLTYVNMHTKTSPQYFYHEDFGNNNVIKSDQIFSNKITRHSI
ncbi:MAG: hypothetical protein RR277_02685, partial [Rikenellaceae bacterium]